MISDRILYEDNHAIVINKLPSELTQGDKTGDAILPDAIKAYLKEKYQKPGNVFLGVVHRLDRPTSGALVFARTSKALERLNAQFRDKETNKVYWAIVGQKPAKNSGSLVHYLKKNESQNKSYVVAESTPGAKKPFCTTDKLRPLSAIFYWKLNLKPGAITKSGVSSLAWAASLKATSNTATNALTPTALFASMRAR